MGDDFEPRFDRVSDNRGLGPKPLPTSGAIQTKNAKGETIIKRVKVQRHVAGQRPKYANECSDEEDFADRQVKEQRSDEDRSRRHRHMDSRHYRDHNEDSYHRHRDDRRHRHDDRRPVQEPEIVRRAAKDDSDKEDSHHDDERERRRVAAIKKRRERDREEEAPKELEKDPDEDDDEDAVQKRREQIRKQQKHREVKEEVQIKKEQRRGDEELLKREDETEEESSSEEETTSEEESSEEEEKMLKPVFVSKKDRITIIEAEEEQKRLEQLKLQDVKYKELKLKENAKFLQDEKAREEALAKAKTADTKNLESVKTDDEEGEIAYEHWKIRELKRLKRNRDEREALAKEKAEIEKVHGMTEEEREKYRRLNPKEVTNKQDKGKYKYLQKYYHRGAFFLDKEDEILQRNYAEATGEDLFDKSVLPTVMQVKNFGKASRTKYTHLTAEDTTDHQGAWATETPLTSKFQEKRAGMKNVFERPAAKKRRKE